MSISTKTITRAAGAAAAAAGTHWKRLILAGSRDRQQQQHIQNWFFGGWREGSRERPSLTQDGSIVEKRPLSAALKGGQWAYSPFVADTMAEQVPLCNILFHWGAWAHQPFELCGTLFCSIKRGGVCSARTRHATFVSTIPTLKPDLPSPREAPQVDQSGPQTFPTKHAA